MGEAVGVEKVVGEAVAAVRSGLGAAPGSEQLGLDLATSEQCLEPDAGEIYAIRAELGEGSTLAQAVNEWRARGARGRMPGAVNKSSADLARYLTQFGPDPAVKLMRMIARPVELLAAELACSIGEAWDRQARVASELLPYFHGKKPVRVEFDAAGGMFVMAMMPDLDGNIVGAAPFMRPAGQAIEADRAPVISGAGDVDESEQNQRLEQRGQGASA